MKIRFDVENLPPKKDGANSMWNKASEFERLVQLRREAIRALGPQKPLRSKVRLTLEIYLPQPEARSAGDLDNFITGVCDGLMAAHPSGSRDPRWSLPNVADIHPDKVAAIVDDGAVLEIVATKREAGGGKSWYRVTLEGQW